MDKLQCELDIIRFLNENATGSYHNVLEESVQNGLSDAVLGKMFELTIGKYSKIDFSDIERSRGDITKIKYYANLRECIDILLDIHSVSDKIPGVLPVSTALSNMLNLKKAFEHAFRTKNNVAIIIYNTVMYSIMEATSYLIATSVDFVKNNSDTEFTVNLYTDSKQHMLIEQLVKFNKTIDDGSLIKFIKETENVTPDSLHEATVVGSLIDKGLEKAIDVATNVWNKKGVKTGVKVALGASALIWVACNIVPFIREMIYWIYKTRQKISDAAELQAEFLETNIEILKSQDSEKNQKIISKQEKHIKRFKAIARVFSIESDKAQRDAKKEISDDKVDVSNIVI